MRTRDKEREERLERERASTAIGYALGCRFILQQYDDPIRQLVINALGLEHAGDDLYRLPPEDPALKT